MYGCECEEVSWRKQQVLHSHRERHSVESTHSSGFKSAIHRERRLHLNAAHLVRASPRRSMRSKACAQTAARTLVYNQRELDVARLCHAARRVGSQQVLGHGLVGRRDAIWWQATASATAAITTAATLTRVTASGTGRA